MLYSPTRIYIHCMPETKDEKDRDNKNDDKDENMV